MLPTASCAKFLRNMSTTFASPEIRAAARLRVAQLGGIALAVFALLLLLALISYNPNDPSLNTATAQAPTNWAGLAGATTADLLLQSFGLAAFLPVLSLVAWSWRLLNTPRAQILVRSLATLLALPALAGLLATLPHGSVVWPTDAGWGGAIGGMIAPALLGMGDGLLGPFGGAVVVVLLAALTLILALLALGLTGTEWRAAGQGVGQAARLSAEGTRFASSFVSRTSQRFKRSPAPEPEIEPDWRPKVTPAPRRPDTFARSPDQLVEPLTAPPGATPAASPPIPSLIAELEPQRPKVAMRKPAPPIQPASRWSKAAGNSPRSRCSPSRPLAQPAARPKTRCRPTPACSRAFSATTASKARSARSAPVRSSPSTNSNPPPASAAPASSASPTTSPARSVGHRRPYRHRLRPQRHRHRGAERQARDRLPLRTPRPRPEWNSNTPAKLSRSPSARTSAANLSSPTSPACRTC